MDISETQRTTFLIGLAVLALFVLAVLQYRWIVALSTLEREQRARTLETSAVGFVRALDREFENIQDTFRVSRLFQGGREDTLEESLGWADSSVLPEPITDGQHPEDILEEYREWLDSLTFPELITDREWQEDVLEEYSEWADSFAFPELITDVFWVEEREAEKQTRDGLRLKRLNLERELMEDAEWGSRLALVGDQLARQSDGSQRSRNRAARSLTGTSLPDGSFVLVEAPDDRPFDGWVIVLLSHQVLFEQFIPFVIREHFGPEDQRDYDVWIMNSSEADGGLIYASNPDASPAGRTSPDILRELADDDRLNWVVAAQHRQGSLEAFIGQYERNNLKLSLATMVVLGASFVLLFMATKRAQSLAQRQMEFVAGMSHELRTPIAGIRSLSQNLADGVVDDLEQTRRYGDSINREGRRLSNMVEGVLRFSAIRSKRHRHQSVPVDFQTLIDDELEALRESSSENPRLTSSVEADLPPVLGDEEALKSMVRNLVANSMKFAGAGGKIRVTAREFTARGRDEIEFRVEDDGPGIDKADLPYVFEPFYRGRHARKTQMSGSGLGLSLVKAIVDAHGGRIGPVSSSDSGTAFSVYLPVTRR